MLITPFPALLLRDSTDKFMLLAQTKIDTIGCPPDKIVLEKQEYQTG